MKMILMIVIPFILLGGCCGITDVNPNCPYSTYGSACSDICAKIGGQKPNCFSECISLVKAEGLGDATTCCKKTFSDWCSETCKETTYFPFDECMKKCNEQYAALGISPNSCYVPI
ncbi:MAG: hypothetical protein QXY63_00285 [Candidatus Bilamarchaeaceae archaeon]